MTTTIVTALGDATGLPCGDGEAPFAGIPDAPDDYPYLVVHEVSDVEVWNLLGTADMIRFIWQVDAVGLSRLQAAAARDRARVIADPATTISSGPISVVSRELVDSVMMHDGGPWTALIRVEFLLAAPTFVGDADWVWVPDDHGGGRWTRIVVDDDAPESPRVGDLWVDTTGII